MDPRVLTPPGGPEPPGVPPPVIVCPVCLRPPVQGRLPSFVEDFYSRRPSLDCPCGRLRFMNDRDFRFQVRTRTVGVFFDRPDSTEQDVRDLMELAVAEAVLEC